jgi:hypothetical protein
MNATAQIFAWLDAVEADRRLRAGSCLKVAYQLTRRTSTAEFAKSGS